ncbi:hypothetical protein JCM8097_000730 [Rhodosporidiobolus ruineniae]
MADYSTFAPSRPPAGQGAAYPMGGQQQRQGAFTAQPGQLVQGMGGLNINTTSSDPYGRPYPHQQPSSSTLSSSPSAMASTSSGYNSAQGTSYAPSQYSAANRPRPQLAAHGLPAASSSSAGAGFGGQSTPAHLPPTPSAAQSTRPPPRKASLPPLPGQPGGPRATDSGLAEPAPPLPPLPTSSSSSYIASPPAGPSAHSSFASIPSTARDSSGGEAIFDGAALAAGGAAAGAGSLGRPLPSRSDTQATATSSSKRANPLEDLIATETQYVEDLGMVIKRVAAAWSRSNFPPPALDSMFRAIEAVYRINKTMLGKLLEIGPSPSSPKALGDLLMRWISDIEPAYTRFATTYQLDYDSYSAVQSNPKLQPILDSLPYPPSLPPSDSSSAVTLDGLFSLPVHRVRYYQKLYAKLLRSTQEGRSDHALLVAANEKLARLEIACEEGKGRSVLGPEERERREQEQREAGERRREPPPRLDLDLVGGGAAVPAPAAAAVEPVERISGESGRLVDSPTSSASYRSSGATGTSTANTSATNSGSPSLPGGGPSAKEAGIAPVRVEDLERRLNTERTLDIFSMQPRKCKLQMQPPSLPYTRQLRRASPCSLSFYPSSDPSRLVTHPRTFLILLTDLFLICEPAPPGSEQDLQLAYPPLAGKHLSAEYGPARGELEVTLLRKERLMFRFADEREAEGWKREIDETARFGMSQAPPRSSSSTGTRSPLSPTFGRFGGTSSSGHTSPLSANFPQPLPNLQTGLSAATSGSNSPGPASPLSNADSSARPFSPDSRYGVNASPSYPTGLQPHDRRAFSGPGPAGSVPRPERNASMGLSPSPSSANFPSSGSSRGPSPYQSSEYHAQGGQYQQGPPPPLQQGRASPYGQPQQHDFAPPAPFQPAGGYGTYPNGMPRSQSDFAPPQAPFAQGGYDSRHRSPSRSSSRQSNGSSDGYPALDLHNRPPPMPKELSYNGMDISGRGGPIYATSLRGEPQSYGAPGGGGYDSRSMTSGRSGLLSPGGSIHRSRSADGLRGEAQQSSSYRLPSQAVLEDRAQSAPGSSRNGGGGGGSKLSVSTSAHHGLDQDVSPPTSPVEPKQPDRTKIIAEMRCKVFLQHAHAQWKSLGTAKLKLFLSQPSNTKQLVVDSDKKGATIVSTIVLTDGVERVGKTGVAIELSDKGDRTGIVYMLQMKTESSATGLFQMLLTGSDRQGR